MKDRRQENFYRQDRPERRVGEERRTNDSLRERIKESLAKIRSEGRDLTVEEIGSMFEDAYELIDANKEDGE